MAAKKMLFLLHDNDIIYVVKEWHYGDFAPGIYYFYLPNLKTMKFKHVYSGKKFEHYERY